MRCHNAKRFGNRSIFRPTPPPLPPLHHPPPGLPNQGYLSQHGKKTDVVHAGMIQDIRQALGSVAQDNRRIGPGVVGNVYWGS